VSSHSITPARLLLRRACAVAVRPALTVQSIFRSLKSLDGGLEPLEQPLETLVLVLP
jgi:hypothetical protein